MGARDGRRSERDGALLDEIRAMAAFCSFDGTEALHPLHGEAAQPGAEHETEPWGT